MAEGRKEERRKTKFSDSELQVVTDEGAARPQNREHWDGISQSARMRGGRKLFGPCNDNNRVFNIIY